MTQNATQPDFATPFKSLTGNAPLRWQERLFHDHLVKNNIPPVIDLPTGLGKTMVMAIWLIARADQPTLPRRLIYVVDRRTVVDQATTLAIKIQRRIQALHRLARRRPELELCCKSFPIPAVSTLRGQLADNRVWTRDPSRPAIIIGTVDLIGSALLFSGYRSSYKRRPLEAGMLGQDSLLVLDEAHLSKPFEKLICAIGEGGLFQKPHDDNTLDKPMQVIRMSATTAQSDGVKPSFALQLDENGNLTDDDAKDTITAARFTAKKRLTMTLGEKDNLNESLAAAAIELAQKPDVCGKRIVIFVRSPEDAWKIAARIRNHEKPAKSKSNPEPKGKYADSVELLTGTMRGLERDELVAKAVFKDRWLNGRLDPSDVKNREPVFLVSTSAGEVGFDLNADHLVGDAAPLDSWIQRLGRVNRRGKGIAIVQVFVEASSEKKGKEKDDDKHTITSASAMTMEVLKQLRPAELLEADKRPGPILDASPFALRRLPKPDKALSPPPTTVELTDVLLDAWSMTSITERMPGRPEVGPWLRGIEKEQAETTVAWRAELELFREHPNQAKALKAVFAKHRIRPHECLTTYSYRIIEFLKETVKAKAGRPNLIDTSLAVRLPRGEIIIRTVGELIHDASILYAEPTLILPATFGGLDEAGMLSAESIPSAAGPNDPPLPSLDVADYPHYEQRDDDAPRLRLVIRRTDEANWVAESLAGGLSIPDRLGFEESYNSSTSLFADLRKANLRIRLVQPIDFNGEGDAVRSLVMLAPIADRTKPEDQSLADHVEAVEKEAKEIAKGLELKGSFRDALLFAARWHDEGKKADVWQRFVYGPDESGAYKGKSSKTRDPKSLRGYRHEFGSLLRLLHPSHHKTLCPLPTDPDTRDLALHLIATHHGFGRPHFNSAVDRDFRTIDCDTVHTESIRRFARLQRKYGWWRLAWLENLLRCADALASADDVSEDDVGEANEGSGENS